MRLAVNPNRMELLNLRRRLGVARKGHSLLEDKLDELMRRFLTLIKDCKGLRDELEAELIRAFEVFLSCRSVMSKKAIEEAVIFPRETPSLSFETARIMNLQIPQLELEGKVDPYTYGMAVTSGQLDTALGLFIKALPRMVKLVQLEATIVILADEIERTRRRVNVLEYVLVPSLEETIKYISMKLSEMGRATTVRLMKVKEILAGTK